MYDIGWSRPLTPTESSSYQAYAALRERAKVEKPDLHRITSHQQALHQDELATWARRFKPELNIALAAFPERHD